ncbi:hypothetical protein KGQ20_16615, partial [Catenulispora sp. NF23]
MLLGFGGITLLGACSSNGGNKPAAAGSTPAADPRSRPTTGGAPFPGQSPSGGDTSTAPGDSHTNTAEPPDSP